MPIAISLDSSTSNSAANDQNIVIYVTLGTTREELLW
jgi:hypothetical protein